MSAGNDHHRLEMALHYLAHLAQPADADIIERLTAMKQSALARHMAGAAPETEDGA